MIKTFSCIEHDNLYSGLNCRENTNSKLSELHFKELIDFALTDNGQYVLRAGNKSIKVLNYVGVIQTKSGFTLEILPKIYSNDNFDNIRKIFMKMLLKSRYIADYKTTGFANLKSFNNRLIEIFISMFIDEVFYILKKGLKSNYVNIENNYNFMKGSLLTSIHIKKNIVNKHKFYVCYDEYLSCIIR